MLKTFKFFGFEAEVDLETTQSWYAAVKRQRRLYDKATDVRNFRAAARKRQLPDFVLEQLDELGIPPQKATYINRVRAAAPYRVAPGRFRLPPLRTARTPLGVYGSPSNDGHQQLWQSK